MAFLASRSVSRIQAPLVSYEEMGIVSRQRLLGKALLYRYSGAMICRLCGAPARSLAAESDGYRFSELSCYERCPSCGYIQLLEDYLPSALNERTRYLLHRNDPADPGYRKWLVSFIEEALLPYAKSACAVLDFGSGPNPALQGILSERGYGYTPFDPFFAPGEAWRARTWPAIVVHEVAEHLRFPGVALSELAGLLEPGGVLALRTRFPPEDPADFLSWHYRQDSTHVGFFSKACLKGAVEALGLKLIHENDEDTLCFKKEPYTL